MILHHLVLLVKRANETAKSIVPETSILGIIYEATSKDPREELRMMSTYSSWNNQSLEEFMLALHKSPYAGPFHSRSVKMNEFKTTNTTYCNRFQVGTCTFGERCRFKHEINNEFKPRDSVMVEMKKKDFTKDKKKKLPNTNIKRIFNPNNYRNSIAGRPRGNYVAGQPQKYFNEQVITFTIFIKTNGNNEERNDSENS